VVHYENAHKTAEYLNVRSESKGCSSLASELWEASRLWRDKRKSTERNGTNGIVWKWSGLGGQWVRSTL